jgi:uncharacterized membrane protein YvbJ
MEINCPYCHEIIKKAAIKCKHCGEFLDSGKSTTKAGLNITINTHSNNKSYHELKDFPHFFHFLISFLTAGLWVPVWMYKYANRDKGVYF